MRILILHSRYLSVPTSGENRVVEDETRLLREGGHVVDVFAPSGGVIDAKSANVENYVTEQALNGLFEMIGKQEETIRQNPAAAATSLAKKVFGTL